MFFCQLRVKTRLINWRKVHTRGGYDPPIIRNDAKVVYLQTPLPFYYLDILVGTKLKQLWRWKAGRFILLPN